MPSYNAASQPFITLRISPASWKGELSRLKLGLPVDMKTSLWSMLPFICLVLGLLPLILAQYNLNPLLPSTGTLQVNEKLLSGSLTLTLHEDCKLVFKDTSTSPPTPLWDSGKTGSNCALHMEASGKLAVVDAGNNELWTTPTDGHPNAWVVLDTYGKRFVVHGGNNNAIWDNVGGSYITSTA